MGIRLIGPLLVVTALLALLPFGAFAQHSVAGAPREAVLGERTLAVGSWGADVFQLQRHLRRLGFDIESDGLYGPKTRDAVRSFQQQRGLDPTGRVGPETLSALNDALLTLVETMSYTLQPGDSLWSVARAFDTTMNVLVELNDLPDRPLRAGEVIQVPALLQYTVKSGDTLSEIAQRFNTSIAEIARLNEMSPGDLLSVGTVLKLPRGAYALPDDDL